MSIDVPYVSIIGRHWACGLYSKAEMSLITRIYAFELGGADGHVLQVRNEDLSKVQP